jgi:hypothetical protein
MTFSLLKSIGRCDGVGGNVSVARFLRRGMYPGYSLKERLNTPLHLGESVDCWLQRHPRIGNAIQWEHAWEPAGSTTNYFGWPDVEKCELQNFVYHFAECNTIDMADPPSNAASLDDFEAVRQEIPTDTAKRWFLAHVAYCLAVEMGDWVPWSLTGYTDDSLANLLDSRHLFHWRQGGGYEIVWYDHGMVLPSCPRFTYEFLYKNDLIGYDSLDTIARVLDWCRWNLGHYYNSHVNRTPLTEDGWTWVGGGHNTIDMFIHWQYRGFPPVRRMIEGTTRHVPDELFWQDGVGNRTDEFGHWTAGCHGTVGFLRAVLRAVNIPVAYVMVCNHAMPYFMHQNLFLSHGDDPYDGRDELQHARREDLHIEDLLIDIATFFLWFYGSERDCSNVGRGAREVIAGLA